MKNLTTHGFSLTSTGRCGFTLFEIAISMALVTFGVVSVLMIFPSGLKAQHHARQQIYASIMMQNLSSWFVEPAQIGLNLQVESRFPTNNQYMRRGLHDLETIAESTGIGLCPVPNDIALRLDSDNDEIRQILAAGGRLYYSKAGPPPQQPLELGELIGALGGPPQTLIIGILGSPQLNALPNHTCLSWPYWDNHPMAPAKWELDNWAINSVKDGTDSSGPRWQCYSEFKALYDVFNSEKNSTGVDSVTWKEYRKKAGELIISLNVPVETSDYSGCGPVPIKPQPYPTNGENWRSMSPDNYDPRPEFVWAISHLAHAASLATAKFKDGGTAPQPEDITYAKLTYEACVAWVQRATVANPYNWGVARHLSTATAWDYPLMQYDIFPTASFPLFGITTKTRWNSNDDVGYRLLSPISVTHYGQARGKHSNGFINADEIGYDSPPTIPESSNYHVIQANWGNPDHYVITRRFDASERMRQVVFWSVDWLNYVDFESLPAPEHDASMCFKDSLGKTVNSDRWGNALAEKGLYWTTEARVQCVGDVRATARTQGSNDNQDREAYKAGHFMGLWGADRNSNGVFERGSVPPSVRMYAVQIARFPIYDRILVSDGRL